MIVADMLSDTQDLIERARRGVDLKLSTHIAISMAVCLSPASVVCPLLESSDLQSRGGSTRMTGQGFCP
jgi:hypothetical protein